MIAADVDQSQLGADYQLAVATKGVDAAVFTVTKELVDGDFKGGPQTLGLKDGGVGLATPGNHVPQDILALADRYKAGIIAGAIVVPTTDEELAAFKPVAPDALPAASPVATPA